MPARRESKKPVAPPAILLIGAGRMGLALMKGWVDRGEKSLIAVEPAPSRSLLKLAKAHRIGIFPGTDHIACDSIGACVVALKPQILKTAAASLRPLAERGVLMISIAAGTSVQTLRATWGDRARIVRAMPNTPGAIGRGISALYAPPNVTAPERQKAQRLLAALGETIWVERESLVDVATAVSGSGPAYVFLLAESLAMAAEAEGFDREIAQRLARVTVCGAGALLDAEVRPAEELRRDVTSPGGTTEAALKVLEGENGLAELIADAVAAAVRRARELGG